MASELAYCKASLDRMDKGNTGTISELLQVAR
jgi:hypothetical protein